MPKMKKCKLRKLLLAQKNREAKRHWSQFHGPFIPCEWESDNFRLNPLANLPSKQEIQEHFAPLVGALLAGPFSPERIYMLLEVFVGNGSWHEFKFLDMTTQKFHVVKWQFGMPGSFYILCPAGESQK